MVKNLPANARDRADTGSIPGLGRSLEEELANHSSILARIIPWLEEPGGLQSVGSQKSWMRLNRLNMRTPNPSLWLSNSVFL